MASLTRSLLSSTACLEWLTRLILLKCLTICIFVVLIYLDVDQRTALTLTLFVEWAHYSLSAFVPIPPLDQTLLDRSNLAANSFLERQILESWQRVSRLSSESSQFTAPEIIKSFERRILLSLSNVRAQFNATVHRAFRGPLPVRRKAHSTVLAVYSLLRLIFKTLWWSLALFRTITVWSVTVLICFVRFVQITVEVCMDCGRATEKWISLFVRAGVWTCKMVIRLFPCVRRNVPPACRLLASVMRCVLLAVLTLSKFALVYGPRALSIMKTLLASNLVDGARILADKVNGTGGRVWDIGKTRVLHSYVACVTKLDRASSSSEWPCPRKLLSVYAYGLYRVQVVYVPISVIGSIVSRHGHIMFPTIQCRPSVRAVKIVRPVVHHLVTADVASLKIDTLKSSLHKQINGQALCLNVTRTFETVGWWKKPTLFRALGLMWDAEHLARVDQQLLPEARSEPTEKSKPVAVDQPKGVCVSRFANLADTVAEAQSVVETEGCQSGESASLPTPTRAPRVSRRKKRWLRLEREKAMAMAASEPDAPLSQSSLPAVPSEPSSSSSSSADPASASASASAAAPENPSSGGIDDVQPRKKKNGRRGGNLRKQTWQKLQKPERTPPSTSNAGGSLSLS
ncbi:hypothetical protein C8Q74DRAFT_1396394 [Fomes fomentarius]|nr:hypothetical protein C8Q74DRAFT_1396394 [Fomes fomentarius]